MDFEKQIAELEEIVRSLESGNVSLDESLALFEKGIKLTTNCKKMLDEAEKKVSILVSDENGNMSEKDFINEE
jgi:exodeoxyribonuclease VII small subunit